MRLGASRFQFVSPVFDTAPNFCCERKAICLKDYGNVIYMNGCEQLHSILIQVRWHSIARKMHLWRKCSCTKQN